MGERIEMGYFRLAPEDSNFGPCDRMLAEMRQIPQLEPMNKQLRWSSIINTPYQDTVPLVDPIVRKCDAPYRFRVVLNLQ